MYYEFHLKKQHTRRRMFMPISPQERELVTIAVAVACGCKTCLRENMLVARSLHVTDKDVADAIKTAANIRRSTTDALEQYILSDFSETAEPEPDFSQHDNPRLQALVSVGTAFAVNCASSLKKYVATAKTLDIPADDLQEVVGLSAYMKAVAASHVEQVMCPEEFEDETNTLTDYTMPFGPEHCAWVGHCRMMERLQAEEPEQEKRAASGGK
ncbi:MAG: carboxymuconolactone decarboxylase family protein [Gammaproteobacteria bacterium]|nr:carboxymuconolactone decarboxylase family protein [Gammaproteobacteria bacterium]